MKKKGKVRTARRSSTTRPSKGREKKPRKSNRYERRIREPDAPPSKSEIDDDGVPRKARGMFATAVVARKRHVLDNGMDGDSPRKRGNHSVKPAVAKRGSETPTVPDAATKRKYVAEVLDKQLPGETLNDFERRLKRGTERILMGAETITRERSESRKLKNQRRKEKSKARFQARSRRNTEEDDWSGKQPVVGLSTSASEPPRITILPRQR
ncbi:hypothetical protein NDN08_002759 [Rhodosorus marinus]|uniref:Ribosome biogenesis protein NOP53 n=1 Tax=Rhodosorus marinus TaxID=101924 RepID=A0AAV8V0E4_9RHOD|nr:hypothetical protein NDN08_002759 [Rhodosorus marinus]